ncbi:Aminopeptidase S [Gemmata obscuriglobus]|nr:M28 family peptidase [Gemmata obscuriglobus]QEG31493.1 Aminopeptidase S [Gemmata obscuriglobus]VTS10835.1 Peptidase M28 OS=Stenotrophomonas maltophilia (strain R551-3) GN=Smal_1208 PE=4 SV=1: Peptidase_M28 [Gemmata obscuriglobus UQM 2246]
MPRVLKPAALGVLCALLMPPTPATPADTAPKARASSDDLDRLVIEEVKARTEIMKNLRYLSDEIGGRLTGSPSLEKANKWTAEKMKEYGLENVRLEPWEIPYGWQRGKAEMKIVEPDTGRSLLVASAGWSPGTKGKVTGDVVILNVRTKKDLEAYKGKLKNAVILRQPPSRVAPISDLTYLGTRPEKKDEPKKDEPKKDAPPKEESKKADPKKDDAGDSGVSFKLQPPAKDGKKEQPKEQPKKDGGGFGGGFQQFQNELNEFLKAEGAACLVSDSGKPHGLLVTTGGWGRGDRAAAEGGIARVYMAHEHYDLLWRLASREKATTRVEVEIENKFIPGPVVVYNTIGEVRGSEKPDEIVVVGAHLDSWDLGSGTTDNGTGSCVVLETARTVAKLARAGSPPKRTIRFCLFSGEEQGLYGSKKYVEKYKDDLPKHSLAIVHDTGTGKVTGFGLQGRTYMKDMLDKELAVLKGLDGWKGLTTGGIGGGTDHWPFHQAGVPGFACNQDVDEYRLTHHTQSDTFDKAKEPNLIQGAQVMAVTALRVANLPELLPRK